MKQRTRKRSYKNAVAIAIASFSAIALISTGLAAFVIIRDASDTTGGNITVGEVSDTQIKVAIDAGVKNGTISLDAEKDDYTGRVQIEQGGAGAKLTHTISGTLEVGSNKTILGNLDLSYVVNIKYMPGDQVANDDFVAQYITENRLSHLVTGFEFATKTTITPTQDAVEANKGTFSFDIGFAWGSKYSGMNPSVFYDTPAASNGGASISDTDVLNELYALQLSKDIGGETQNYTFEVVVYANNK